MEVIKLSNKRKAQLVKKQNFWRIDSVKKKKCKFSNWLSNLFLLLLMVLGLALNFNNQLKNFLIKENSETYALNKIDQTDIEKNTEASFDFDAVKPISFEVVLEEQLCNKKRPVIGRIAILGVEINSPIFKGIPMKPYFTVLGH